MTSDVPSTSSAGLVLGGYLAVPRAVRADWQSDLVPEQTVTVSECLTHAEHGPPYSAWHTDPHEARRHEGQLLAIGFTPGDAAELLAQMMFEFEYGSKDKPIPVPDCLSLLAAHAAMPRGAETRGFEVIGVEWALSSIHSWLCHSYERDAADELDVHLNQWGLLSSYDDASTVLEWMLALPSNRSPEPAYWTVAAITEHQGPTQ